MKVKVLYTPHSGKSAAPHSVEIEMDQAFFDRLNDNGQANIYEDDYEAKLAEYIDLKTEIETGRIINAMITGFAWDGQEVGLVKS